MVEEFGGEWIHVYICWSLFTIHLKLSQHGMLVGYTPIHIKKLRKNKYQIIQKVCSMSDAET